MTPEDRVGALATFYELLNDLATRVGGARTLSECSKATGWPSRGVYFFFEPGEFRADGSTPRVVRVGTHGLRPSKSTLWGRLSQHRGSPGGALPGGGNHRGSIFRLHVGAALATDAPEFEAELASWGRRNSADRATKQNEYALERAVTAYIGAMPFLWVEVDDPPAALSERGIIEAGAISLLSNFGRPAIDPPSESWLGHRAARPSIRASGLWNVNRVQDPPNADFLVALERRIRRL